MFRPDREPRGEDPLLLVKITIFVIAAAVGLTGMALQRPWVISGAIALLASGFLLRFFRTRHHDSAIDGNSADPPPDDDRRLD
jgi:fatty acid desaturase